MRVHEAYTQSGLFPLSPTPPPGAVVLLSDLHLDLQPPGKLMALGHVLARDCAQAGALWVLGDLADALHRDTGRNKMETHAAPFFSAVAGWVGRGAPVHYVPGNHDAHFRRHPLQWPAFAVLNHGPQAIVRQTLFGRRARLSHGDELDSFEQSPVSKVIYPVLDALPGVYHALDKLYQAEHWWWKTVAPAADLLQATAPGLADDLRWRAEMAQGAPSFFVGTLHRWEEAAAQALAGEKVDLVVMGHTHTARLEPKPGGIYLNTGDWCEHAVVNWVTEQGVYQQDLSREPAARFLPFDSGATSPQGTCR